MFSFSYWECLNTEARTLTCNNPEHDQQFRTASTNNFILKINLHGISLASSFFLCQHSNSFFCEFSALKDDLVEAFHSIISGDVTSNINDLDSEMKRIKVKSYFVMFFLILS